MACMEDFTYSRSNSLMLGLLSLSSIEAYRRQGREKAMRLDFPFLGSCVWVLQCLKERRSQRLRNRFLYGLYGVLFRSWRE